MDSYPAILGAILACSVLVMSALGLANMPAPPTDEQIAAAQTYLDGVCVSCPVYENLEPAATAAAGDIYPTLSRTVP